MQLQRIRIENYRGIGSLELRLAGTTVLIGRASTGKASLVDALSAAVGFDAPATGFGFLDADFRRTEGGEMRPIRLQLEFREGRGEERDERPLPAALEPAVFRVDEDRRGVLLDVQARRGEESGEVHVDWCFLDGEGRTLVDGTHADVLLALRAAFPILIVRGGFAFGNESLRRAPRTLPESRAGDLDRETRERVRDLYRELLDTRGVASELEESRELYGRVCRYALERLEIDAPAWIEESIRAPRTDANLGSERRLGVLLLAGSLIEARSRGHGGALERPILVVEDPEAHLHPATLTSVWLLLELMNVQKLITTNSESFLAEVPLHAVQRLERSNGLVKAHGLRRHTLTTEELRRVSYHVRVRRGEALFARSWLLVEGETEFWLLPGLARQCGWELAIEGVCCVEFAQCGVVPLAKLARDLGIEWHLLTDGDEAGRSYIAQARSQLHGSRESERITALPAVDVEHYLWDVGFAEVFQRVAGRRSHGSRRTRRPQPTAVIQRAIHQTSKPHMALEVLQTLRNDARACAPPLLRHAIEAAVRLARRELGTDRGRERVTPRAQRSRTERFGAGIEQGEGQR